MALSAFRPAAVSLLLLVAGAEAAAAASLEVFPVRVSLGPETPHQAISLRNRGSRDALIQAEVMAWTQDRGRDGYSPSSELLVNPPIFTVPAGGSQVIRIGLDRPVPPDRELAYRLFLQEVPVDEAVGTGLGMRMVLRLGIPVFVAPSAAIGKSLLWSAFRSANGEIGVRLRNEGNLHIQVSSLTLMSPGPNGQTLGRQAMNGYVLPGGTQIWPIRLSSPFQDRKLLMSVVTDQGTSTVELDLDADLKP